jgi:hypothetical protein
MGPLILKSLEMKMGSQKSNIKKALVRKSYPSANCTKSFAFKKPQANLQLLLNSSNANFISF